MKTFASLPWFHRISYLVACTSLSLALTGCRAPAKSPSETDATDTTTLSPDSPLEGQKIALASFSDRLLFKASQQRPVIGTDYIVDYSHGDLAVYETATLNLVKIFSGVSCDQAPTFLNDSTLILSSNQSLVSVDLESHEVKTLARLDAPLITAPAIVQDRLVFLQYMNNIAQCFDLQGHSLWKTMLPYSASYYKQTSYIPCSDSSSIYLAYPGSSLIKLNQKTGLIEWISAATADSNPISNTSFMIRQLSAPLKTSNTLIFAQMSDNTCLCIDKNSGRLVETIRLAEKSESYVKDDCLYALTEKNTLFCYDAETLAINWSVPLAEGSASLIGSTLAHPKTLFIQDAQGKLLAIDASSGESLKTLALKYQGFDIFSRSDNLYAFNSHGTLVKIQLPSDLS